MSDPNVMFGQGHDLRLMQHNLVGVHLAKDQARLSDLVFIPFLEHFGCPGEDPSNLQSQNDLLRPWHGFSEILNSSFKVLGLSIMISFFAFVDTFFELRRLLPGGRRFLRVWKHEQVKPKAVFATYLVYDLLTTMTS